jgi:hypothetical protein
MRLLPLCLFLFLLAAHGASADSSAVVSCGNADAKTMEQYVTVCLNLPEEVVVESATYLLNIAILQEQNLVVYGSPKDVPNNDVKEGQYRYLGYTDSGGLFPNHSFPEDATGENRITRRNLIRHPWEQPDQYQTRTYRPSQPEWWYESSREDIAAQLSQVIDKYYGTEKSPQGDFVNLNNGANWAEWFYDYATFSQSSTAFSPGIITEMHQSFVTGAFWYDTFLLAPKFRPFGDLWIDPEYLVLTNPKAGEATDVQVKVHSSFDIPMTTKLFYRLDTQTDVQSLDAVTIPARKWDDATNQWLPGERVIAIPQVLLPILGSQVKKGQTSLELIANLNPTMDSPPMEVTEGNPNGFANNRVVWDLVRLLDGDPLETPPIHFRDITPYEAIPYWDQVDHPDFDHFEVYCSPSYSLTYNGPYTEFSFNSLNPSTTYECQLKAIGQDGTDGGFQSGTFTTLPIEPPSGSGYWRDRGIIREIDQARQSLNNIPNRALHYGDYTVDEVRSAANQYSPYFGEKLGAYAIPSTHSYTYYWTFQYWVWTWWGGYTATATDSCKIEYVPIAPSTWTNITVNPVDTVMTITNDYNQDVATVKVSNAVQKQCVGSHPYNANRYQFSYWVPTEYATDPAVVVLDTGFDPVTNAVIEDYKRLKFFLNGAQKELGSDGRTLSNKQPAVTEIPFSMLWSKYSAIGAGE